jgi:hypothetical protein
MPRRIITEREELGQGPPGAAIRQLSPHLRQCPLVFGGAAVWHEFRCRAKCRPRRDRTSARFEPRRRHLDRAEQRAQPPGARVLQRAQAQAVRAMAAQCAVLRNPGLNQVTLHARQQRLAVVQRQAERSRGEWDPVPPPRATSWVCFVPSTPFSSIVTRHSIPAPGRPGAEGSTPMFGTVSSVKSGRFVRSGQQAERRPAVADRLLSVSPNAADQPSG